MGFLYLLSQQNSDMNLCVPDTSCNSSSVRGPISVAHFSRSASCPYPSDECIESNHGPLYMQGITHSFLKLITFHCLLQTNDWLWCDHSDLSELCCLLGWICPSDPLQGLPSRLNSWIKWMNLDDTCYVSKKEKNYIQIQSHDLKYIHVFWINSLWCRFKP